MFVKLTWNKFGNLKCFSIQVKYMAGEGWMNENFIVGRYVGF